MYSSFIIVTGVFLITLALLWVVILIVFVVIIIVNVINVSALLIGILMHRDSCGRPPSMNPESESVAD